MNTRIIFFTSILFISFTAFSQVQVTLNVSSNPTPELYEWANRTELAILTVTNSEQALVGLDYKIKVKLLLDNELVLETNNNVVTQKLMFGTQTFLADEIIPYDGVTFIKKGFKNKLIQTGLLPAGFYSFCVSIVDNQGHAISTPSEVCRSMLITQYQLPELLFPIDDFQINSVMVPTILFNWSPVSPEPPADLGVKYIITVTEVQPGQSVSQAFHVNYPIIEEEVIGLTQFNWPLDIDIPTETTQYVWSVKPVTFNDNPFKSGINGYAFIETFTIVNNESDPFSPLKLGGKSKGKMSNEWAIATKGIKDPNTGNGTDSIPKPLNGNITSKGKMSNEWAIATKGIKNPNTGNDTDTIAKPLNGNITSKGKMSNEWIIGTKGIKNPNTGNDTGVKAMSKSLKKLTSLFSSESKLSIKEQNANYYAIKSIAKKMLSIKSKNLNKKGAITKKEKKHQLADIKAMAESLVNLSLKSKINSNRFYKKEKLAAIKAMTESLVNLTIKN